MRDTAAVRRTAGACVQAMLRPRAPGNTGAARAGPGASGVGGLRAGGGRDGRQCGSHLPIWTVKPAEPQPELTSRPASPELGQHLRDRICRRICRGRISARREVHLYSEL